MRRAIADDIGRFRKFLADKSLRRYAGELQGGRLARVPRGFDPAHPAADVLRLKQLYFDVTLPAQAALEPSIRKEVTARFRAMAPVIHFSNEAALAALRRDADTEGAVPKRPAPMF